SMLLSFLPRLLSALLILVVGWLAANFLGQAMLIAAVNAGIHQARLLARATRSVVLLFTVATALVEVGIGRDMVLIAFGVLFGGLVLALALAFGLGGRHLAREILESGRRREHEPAPQDSITHLQQPSRASVPLRNRQRRPRADRRGAAEDRPNRQ